MSVRAYKINKIDHEKGETFNLSHDTTIFNNLVDTEQLNSDCAGVIEISEADIKGLISEIKGEDTKVGKDEDKQDILNKLRLMKKQAKPTGYVDYYCY